MSHISPFREHTRRTHKQEYSFGALVRAIRMDFILQQLERVPQTFQCAVPKRQNDLNIRQIFLDSADNVMKKDGIDFEANILCPTLKETIQVVA